MRWFAYFSEDEESCWGEIPLESHLDQVQGPIARLIAALKGNEKHQSSSGDKKKTAVVVGLLGRSSATSKIPAGNFTVDGAKREELIGGLRELVSAVSNVVGVRFRLVETRRRNWSPRPEWFCGRFRLRKQPDSVAAPRRCDGLTS